MADRGEGGDRAEDEKGTPENPIIGKRNLTHTIFAGGTRRTFKDLERKEWILLGISALSLLVTLVLTIWKIAILPKTSNDFAFALVLLLSTVFCVWYLVEGILFERPYELLALSTSAFAVLLYVILNFAFGSQDSIKLVRLILTCILSPPIIGLTIWIASEYLRSGRLIFRTVGANKRMQQLCWTLYRYLAMFKLDLQLSLSMVIFILTTGEILDTTELVIIIAGAIIIVGCALIGYRGVCMENQCLSMVYVCTLIIQPCYVIRKIEESAKNFSPENDNLALPTFVCGVLALVVRLTMIILFLMAWRNYGKGLKDKLNQPESNYTELKEEEEQGEQHPLV